MKITSQTFTKASGSMAGMTASRNRGGMYLRARAMPVNPNSAAQLAVRTVLAGITAAWQSTLTQAQRDAWALYAVNVPVIDSLGSAINLTGNNWFLKCNSPRVQAGMARVDDGPTTFNTGSLSPVGASASEGTQLASITFDNTDQWATAAGGGLLIYVSRPMSPTINFFKGPFNYAGKVLGASPTAPTSPQTVAVPFPVAEDQVIYVRAQATAADGRLTAEQIIRVVVGA